MEACLVFCFHCCGKRAPFLGWGGGGGLGNSEEKGKLTPQDRVEGFSLTKVRSFLTLGRPDRPF